MTRALSAFELGGEAGRESAEVVGLEPGGSDQNLKPGDHIKMTQSAVVLENLLSQFLYSKAAEPGGEKK